MEQALDICKKNPLTWEECAWYNTLNSVANTCWASKVLLATHVITLRGYDGVSKESVFLSYAREDFGTAKQLVQDLRSVGLDVWFDRDYLVPGQRWKDEIVKAIRNSSYFLALLSSRSVSKRGYVQRELKEALEVLDEVPRSEIFLIPVRIENCKTTDYRLSELHWVDLFPSYEEGLQNVLRVFQYVGEGPTDLPGLVPASVSFDFESKPQIEAEFRPFRRADIQPFKVKALIDTGADVSGLPSGMIESLKGRLDYSIVHVKNYDGHLAIAPVYIFDVSLGSEYVSGIRVIALHNVDSAWIGNDVMKHFVLLIDGPAKKVRIWSKRV